MNKGHFFYDFFLVYSGLRILNINMAFAQLNQILNELCS